MKIIFFGSDDFAAVHLEQLLAHGHEILAVVTGPDRQQGRGMKIIASPIKEIALKRGIVCLQPLSLKESSIVSELKSYQADIFVVVAYGRLLTREVLDIPRWLCINVHGSLLPKYRGAAPVNWAVLNGDKETGVTLQKMALALDAGDIIAQERIKIEENENAAQLRSRMSIKGAALLVSALQQNASGDFPLIPQDVSQVSWAPKLTKEMGLIDWKVSARSIIDQVRGLMPWPGAYTFYQGKMLKIVDVQLSSEIKGVHVPGQVINANKEGLHVACGEGVLLIRRVQPEAGKQMPASSFVAGLRGDVPLSF